MKRSGPPTYTAIITIIFMLLFEVALQLRDSQLIGTHGELSHIVELQCNLPSFGSVRSILLMLCTLPQHGL